MGDREANDADGECPLRRKDADLMEMVTHNILFCRQCREEMIREKMKGSELNFQERTLPQKKEETVESNDQGETGKIEPTIQPGLSKRAQKRFEFKAKRFAEKAKELEKKKDLKKNEMLRSAKGAIKYYGKMGLTKEDALKKFVEDKKKEKPENEKNRLVAERSELPWAPRFPEILKDKISSIPNPAEQQRYVAIVTNFLTPNSVPRFHQNLMELRMMDEKLREERKTYQDLVMKSIRERSRPLYHCEMKKAISYILTCMNNRFASVASRYGTALFDKTFENNVTDIPSGLKAKVLHQGKAKKIKFPNERRRFTFTSDMGQILRRFPPDASEQFPLENDQLASNLALSRGVNVVLSSSAAVAIMSRHWVGDSCNYLIPVTVKSVLDRNQGRFYNVCFVGKPCVDKTMDAPSAWRRFMKKAIKLTLYPDLDNCKVAKKSGGRQRTQMKKHDSKENKVVERSSTSGLQDATVAFLNKEDIKTPLSDSDSEKGWVIAEDDDEEEDQCNTIFTDIFAEKIKKEKTANRGESSANVTVNDKGKEEEKDDDASKVRINDLLGDIMSGMQVGDNDRCIDEDLGIDFTQCEGACLNKMYSTFSLGYNGTENVCVLVRANNDGTDANGDRIAVTHKLEYAPEFGAERITVEESLRDYFRGQFKNAKQIVRVRVHSVERHLLQIERCNISSFDSDLTFQNCIAERMQWLKRLAIDLKTLDAGKYLLRKEDNRFQIYPEAISDNEVVIELKSSEPVQFDKHLPSAEKVFNGIDEHLVLVYHIVQKRIPASFGPKREIRNGPNVTIEKLKGKQLSNTGGQNRKRKRNFKGGEKQWNNSGQPPRKFTFIDYDQPEEK